MAVFKYNDVEVDLPKKTMKVVKGLDDCYRADGMSREKGFREMHKFIVDTVGKDQAKEWLGSTSVESVDMEDVAKIFKGIEYAYIVSLQEYENELVSPQLDKVTELVDKLKVINQVKK